MEPEDKKSDSSFSKAAIVGTGIVCSIVGAAIGAIGYHFMKEEEKQQQQQQQHSHSRPQKVYTDGTCPICLETMDKLTVLPCGHQLHTTCTKQLEDNDPNLKCPMCRKNAK